MSLPRLNTSGVSFIDSAGHPLTYCGFTEFRLFDKYFKGEGINDILRNRKALFDEVRAYAAAGGDGAYCFPVLRVLGMMHNISHFYPDEIGPSFYSATRSVVDYAARWGFYTQFDINADCQWAMPDRNRRVDHALRLYQAFEGCKTVFFSKGNEWRKNGFDPLEIPDPPDEFIWTQGSTLGDENPVQGGSYSCFHGKRQPGPRVELSSGDLAWVVHGWDDTNEWPGTHRPTIHDEPIGFGEPDDPKRSHDTRLAHGVGMLAAKFGAGGTFHSTAGVNGQTFGPVTWACAQAFMVGLAKVDPVQRYQG